MKQFFRLSSLPFCFYIAIYFIGTTNIQAIDKFFREKSHNQVLSTIYTTLHVIKTIHQDVQDQDELMQQDFIIDILVVLTGTYEKIIGATVTYYLMMNMPLQENLHNTVAVIITEDVIKIIQILCKRFLKFIFDRTMSLQEKVWHCVWVASIIVIVKLGIDQIPQQIKQEATINDTIKEMESLYLKDKFAHYK